MKVRSSVLTLAMLFVGFTLCFASNPNLGTWKLNEAKSKIDPGLPKNVTVVYEAEGNNIKSTVDRDIYLTPPTPRCSVRGHERGFSEDLVGVGTAL